jgi:hypothetical protein
MGESDRSSYNFASKARALVDVEAVAKRGWKYICASISGAPVERPGALAYELGDGVVHEPLAESAS